MYQIKTEELNCHSDVFLSELQAVISEIAKNTVAIRSEVNRMKEDLKDTMGRLSTWSEEVTSLQTAITCLQSKVEKLTGKNKLKRQYEKGKYTNSGRRRTTGLDLSQGCFQTQSSTEDGSRHKNHTAVLCKPGVPTAGYHS